MTVIACESREKYSVPILNVRPARSMNEGAGAEVRRLMPIPEFMNYDPFVLWDDFTIRAGTGFPSHPHRGFEAITYMFEGTMQHKDNLGNESTVGAGGAQRFTAGRGLEHSEMPSPHGISRGIQLWINLPASKKSIAPEYQQVDAGDFPERTFDHGAVRVIVGEGSPLKLHTPVRYLDVRLAKDGVFREQLPPDFRGLIYIVDGSIRVGAEAVAAGDSCFLDDLDLLEVRATTDARFMVCVGKPHREPIRQRGPYVD